MVENGLRALEVAGGRAEFPHQQKLNDFEKRHPLCLAKSQFLNTIIVNTMLSDTPQSKALRKANTPKC